MASEAGSGAKVTGIAATAARPADAPIAVDDGFANDGDSALGVDDGSSMTSIMSSILNYRTLHGRTYHSETGNAQYWGANDEAQATSMDLLHHLVTLAIGDTLFLAPLKDDIKRAVDIGTGTGTWAIDFADQFPACEVTGTDISPIQPTWVPTNLKFAIEDCTQPWTFAPDSLDYVHIRYMVGSIADWTDLFKQAYAACRPGGYLETIEGSPVMESDDGTAGEAMSKWGNLFIEGGQKIGRSFTVYHDGTQKKAMEAAGFVDVRVRDFKCPMGRWPRDPKYKEIGIVGQAAVEGDVEGFVMFMANVLGWSKEEIKAYTAKMREELKCNRHHVYFRMRGVWGRKPEG